MPTIAYAPSDHGPSADGRVAAGAVRVADGCGEQHQIQVDDHGRPYMECDVCAPIQMGRHWGWAATPHGVPLTPDEQAERELANRDASKARDDLANAAILEFMRQQRAAAVTSEPSLADVLAKVSPEELLAALPGDMRKALETAAGSAAHQFATEPPPPARPRTARSTARR